MENKKPNKKHTVKEAWGKILRFCVYQERTQQHVRDKLYELGLYGDDVENTIIRLSQENFINEERFAKAYCSGKFRQNKWGKNKILQGLKNEKISTYCIKKGMAEIDADDYEKTLTKLFIQKWESEKEKNELKKKYKVANFLISKGYENDLVWGKINEKTSN